MVRVGNSQPVNEAVNDVSNLFTLAENIGLGWILCENSCECGLKGLGECEMIENEFFKGIEMAKRQIEANGRKWWRNTQPIRNRAKSPPFNVLNSFMFDFHLFLLFFFYFRIFPSLFNT